MIKKNKILILSLIIFSLLFSTGQAQRSADPRPNIVLLFIDDLGYGDIGAFGSDIPTPHIDSLAMDGISFTNGYAVMSICSPSRAATMTGLYPQRFGVYGNDDRGVALPKDHPSIAQTLRDAGYATGMVGRWDLGDSSQGPFDIGFQEVAMRRRPLPADQRDPAHQPRWARNPVGVTFLGRDGSYWTEVNGPEFREFVQRHADTPFYLYYAPLAVHFPVEEVPEHFLARVPDEVKPDRRYMAGTLIALDDAIGELLEELKQQGLYENTLIFFMGDNGGQTLDFASNGPLRGGKQSQWEGGFRVPYIVSWPRRLAAGVTDDRLVSSLDVYPTAAAVAGVNSPDNLDGVNLLPYLTGERTGPINEVLFFRWIDNRSARWDVKAMRRGDWRLLVHAPANWESPSLPSAEGNFVTELYHLGRDLGETTDLSAQYPEVLASLVAEYEAWEATLPPKDRNKEPGSGSDQAPMPYGEGWAFEETWKP
jgi:arylsulfatase A-like enzyme